MSIDLYALARAADGNTDVKVAVSKSWLREVHRLLVEGEQAKAALRASTQHHKMRDSMDSIFEQLLRPR